jgi:hypothetical protein
MRKAAFALLLIFGVLSYAQSGRTRTSAAPQKQKNAQPQAEKLFRIGMSSEEMEAAFGPPQQYLATHVKRHISRQEYLAVHGEGDLYRPIYVRKTERNEYEIVIMEEVDETKSHLHPTVRIKELQFKFDRDMTAAEAVQDIAEARDICAGGCRFAKSSYFGINAIKDGADFHMFFLDPKSPVASNLSATSVSRVSIVSNFPGSLD